MVMKKHVIPLLLVAIAFGGEVRSQSGSYPITAAGVKQVTLNDNFWLPKIKTIQNTTIQYSFEKCSQEGRMENFLIAGKQKSGKTRGQMPFDDTDLYKIIEGASCSLISSPNKQLESYLDSIISIIKIGQEPDGYLTTWFTIDPASPPADWVKPSTKRWQNESMSHELYNSGHLFEAAATHYWATGKRNFLDIALKNADLLVANFGPNKAHHAPPGHQIVETGLIKLYQITQNKSYLELAKYLLDVRGDSTTHELYGDYAQDHMPLVKQTEAVGHAVRAEYVYAAMTDIAALYDNKDYLKAVMSIWDNVVYKKMYLTGGVGARHSGEAFGDSYELPNLTAYNETCAAIGSVYWNHRLFLLTGESKYYDIIERTLYNGLISGISLDGKNFFYPNPLESDGKYGFNNGGECTRAPWFNCSCCPTNMIRFLPSISGLIYATHSDSLFVNLYISSKANIQVGKNSVEVVQQSSYPWSGSISLVVSPKSKAAMALKLRVPYWALNKVADGDLYSYVGSKATPIKVTVNGKVQNVLIKDGYIVLARKWSRGDRVVLDMPMEVRQVVANPNVKEDLDKVAFEYGPFVYCAEQVDNSSISEMKVPQDLQLNPEQASILTENVKVLKGSIGGKEVKLIPYYLWSNRGVGKMKVWIPTSK